MIWLILAIIGWTSFVYNYAFGRGQTHGEQKQLRANWRPK